MKSKNLSIAVIGATGLIGRELISLLLERHFFSLKCFASKTSYGKKLQIQNHSFDIDSLSENKFTSIELAFFCAGKAISLEWIPKLRKKNILCIDLSSAFRMNEDVPLIIPEINAHAIKKHSNLIASPNCTTTIMLLPLFPLHRSFHIKRIVASTYQAASGGGKKLMECLINESKNEDPISDLPYAFNLFLHNSPLLDQGYNQEEWKMIFETKKILEDSSIQVSPTCVRVPVLRAHSISLNVSFEKSFSLSQIIDHLVHTPSVYFFGDEKIGRFATPFDATKKEKIYCSRPRIDPTYPNTLDLWVVGDQILKGGALNAVQIAEIIYEKSRCVQKHRALRGQREPVQQH